MKSQQRLPWRRDIWPKIWRNCLGRSLGTGENISGRKNSTCKYSEAGWKNASAAQVKRGEVVWYEVGPKETSSVPCHGSEKLNDLPKITQPGGVERGFGCKDLVPEVVCKTAMRFCFSKKRQNATCIFFLVKKNPICKLLYWGMLSLHS